MAENRLLGVLVDRLETKHRYNGRSIHAVFLQGLAVASWVYFQALF